MESRIKMLREKRGLIQELLAVEIGVTQQMLSKYEKDITIIKVDVLKRIAEYFNVTTDYLLGLSDMKRDLSGQIKMNETLDEYYDLIEVYRRMDGYDREMVWSIMQTVGKTAEKRKRGVGNDKSSDRYCDNRKDRGHVVPHSKEKLYSDRNRSVLGRRASVRGSREYEQL